MKLLAPLLPRLLATALVTAAALPAWAAEPAKAAAKPDLARGQEISTQVCAACHTADGSRGTPANPILQGQIPEYLVKQLQEFKSGKRENAIMQGMSATLSDADMKNVAAFYASKEAKPGFAKNKDTVVLGEKIYRGGIADRMIPACAGCHTPDGGGAVSASVGPACRVQPGPVGGVSRRRAQEQPADDRRRGQDERPRDQGRVRLHRRPAQQRCALTRPAGAGLIPLTRPGYAPPRGGAR